MSEKSVKILDTIDEVHPNQWNTLVEQAELGTVFHRHEWIKAIEEGFGSEPKHIIVEKDDNPLAVFPNFYDSIETPVAETVVERAPVRELNSVTPGFGGPITGGNEEECLELMFDALEELYDIQTVYHWIRTNKLGYIRYGQMLTDRGFIPITTDCHFRLDITQPWEDIWDAMESDYRRRLRKMKDHDVEYRDEPINSEVIGEFYDRHTRNLERIGTEPYPLSFYHSLANLMGDRLKIFTAVVDGEKRGQYLYLLDEERATLHHYLAAIGYEDHYQYNPSQLLHKNAIQWGQEQGYEYYDFGSTRANHTDGVFRHKEGYGGQLVPSLHWRKGVSPVGWPAFVVAQKLIRRARG